MEQPKDYEIQTFEEMFEQEFKNLTLSERVMYHLQNHVVLLILLSFAGGYLAGTYFGVFW